MKFNPPSDDVVYQLADQVVDQVTVGASSGTNAAISPGEIIIGTLVALNEQGQPLVDFPQNTSAQAVVAMSTLAISQANAGRQLALLFANGALDKPVIMGMIHAPLQSMLENYVPAPHADDVIEKTDAENDAPENDTLEKELSEKDEITQGIDITDEVDTKGEAGTVLVDGNKLVLEAKEEIVLKCGESSITLTKSGKILIRGKYLLNRSTGVNRIMGGSVQVN
ncbi:MAG: hypothetical protein ACJAUP_003106 [Cellvibrionaceae bacterium]|jgi:hypothetical protein